MFSQFITGFRYFFKGLSFIRHNPALWKYIIIPLVINATVFGGGFVLFILKLSALLDRFIGKEGAWSIFLYYLLAFILVLSFIVAAFYVFTIMGNLIAAPFNATLSERVELLVSPHPSPVTTRGILPDALRAVKTEIKKLALLLALFVPILLINLLPVIGQVVSAVLTLAYTCLAISFNFIDYAMERHHDGLTGRYRIVLSRKALSFGFGAACFLFGIIPFVNLIMIPVCVVAGTLMYHYELQPGPNPLS